MSASYNAHSLRVRKAKLAGRIGQSGSTFGLILLIALLGIGGYLLATNNPAYGAALGLAIWGAILLFWYRWDLRQLPASPLPTSNDPLELDQLLAADIVATISEQDSPAQLWGKLSRHWQFGFLANRFGLPAEAIGQALTALPSAQPIWEQAAELSRLMRFSSIEAGSLTCALILACPGIDDLLAQLKLDRKDLLGGLQWLERTIWAIEQAKEPAYFGGIARDWASGFTTTLNRFGHNLSTEVESGNYRSHSLAHSEVINQMMVNLAKPQHNSVVLVGNPGVGKTSLVYALAERLLAGQLAGNLVYQQVISLNAAFIISGSQQLESTILALLSEAAHAGNIIVFLDEAQLFFGSGAGAVDLSQILLPVLQNSSLRMILAMAPADWQRLVGANPALTSLINAIKIPEPTEEAVTDILEDATPLLEARSGTLITYQAIKEAYRAAERYRAEESFPGKAVKMLEDSVNYPEATGVITPASVQTAVEQTLGVKASPAAAEEKSQLLELENIIHQRMINQSRAVQVVADALRRARAGVRNPNRPVGSFLFLGPTGVGKTELSKALAAAYFGGENQMIRLDMSEYQQPSDLNRLLDGNSAGSLLLQLRQQPFSVVLLDEIEKAHPDILNLLLQILDEGHLTDSSDRRVSFKEAIVICTSNAGADDIRSRIASGQNLEQFEDELVDQLISQHLFRQELLNRFDEIVLFRPLNKDELNQVVTLMLDEVNKTLSTQKVSVSLTPAAISWLVDAGYDPRLGARPMRRMVQRAVENTVAKRILSGQAKPGETIKLDVTDLETGKNAPAAP